MASTPAANPDDVDFLDEEPLDGNIQNIVEQKTLKWIFVGGKGGVGKTTTSCSLAVQLSKHRSSVLIISTDPAHNLSDAFGQKFGPQPTAVNGIPNLHAMEIEPKVEVDLGDDLDLQSQNLVAEMTSSIPGIDEAMSFAELMKQVQSMNYSVIVFDTAPTGHTLRLLSFPSILEKAFAKVMSLKSKFQGVFQQFQTMLQESGTTEDQVLARLETTKKTIEVVNAQFMDPDITTFVCVAIPEFLSLYETERLVQELSKFQIDTHNVVVNQVLFPEADSTCRKCAARVRMQSKYLNQIFDLYDDFNVTVMPLLDEEVRGPAAINSFADTLLNPPPYPGRPQ